MNHLRRRFHHLSLLLFVLSPQLLAQSAQPSKAKAVDLGSLDAAPTPPTSIRGTSPHGHPSSPESRPELKVLFDLALSHQPGKAEFTFQNFHPLILLEAIPTRDLMIALEVNPTPRYFEMDYQATEKLTFRAGKLWIPFDDLNPHNIFGGRINTSRLRIGGQAFMPDLFTDLGMALKYVFTDNAELKMEGHVYAVNGFPSGGSDPLGVSASYPNFADVSVNSTDNNNDKAMGARLHANFAQRLGIGASFYTGVWSDQAAAPQRLHLLGVDSQIRMGFTEFRVGGAFFQVKLDDATTFERLGTYGELSQKFGNNAEWKFLGRIGTVDPDRRIEDENDQLIAGAAILYRPSLIEWSGEFSYDLKSVSGKRGTYYAALRAVMQL